ncbi:MAG: FHA domain-containing protein [Gemmataceae bacterium]|nr:FHA domain-containing protein [Gemmataceae bacterium]
MKVSLVVATAGKSLGQVIPITLAQFVIGRDPQCNLRPASALISKRHCAILTKSGQVFVRDFDSTNGTFINDQPVKGELPLQHDDVLKVGPLAFKVQIEGAASISKPTPPPQSAASADDEAAAAMLLGLQDDTGAGGEGNAGSDSAVPSGSTVFDLPNPVTGTGEAPAAGSDDKNAAAKKPDAKAAAASASKAAESLLAKYTRRQR